MLNKIDYIKTRLNISLQENDIVSKKHVQIRILQL